MREILLLSLVVIGCAYVPQHSEEFDISCYDEKDKGLSYTGLATKTLSGRECQNWLVNHPHKIKSTIHPQTSNGIANHNYCRNPDGSQEKPWCYTMDPSPDHMVEICNIPVCPKNSRDFHQDAQFLGAHMGEVNLGSFSFGRRGLEIKPQFKFGFESEHFAADVGLGDVRDGLRVAAKASVFVEARTEGHNVRELNQNLHMNEEGFHDAFETAKRILTKSVTFAQKIAEALSLPMAKVEAAIAGQMNSPGDVAKLHVVASMDVGVSAEVRLGWCDTKGYQMVGAGGSAATAVNMRASFFAGKHTSGTKIKIILMIGNFAFEYTLPVAE
eukprot:gnl/MRDRNA2_/MRDRNA2_111552_c0_seq1.p1 gnl/MRDRNA2_/MRDRNA2_111552_c0~~gnl/MRDRNA2_/MRDRNA2_111552_c0_seq1.p1  ORF type:complete len:328 (-),score=49.96 gnl/MRDRNA2_/MRDRNA2_111552_c0_seq1:70-1053(-)